MRPNGLALVLIVVVVALRASPLHAKVLTVTLFAEPYAGINSLVSVHADLDSTPDKVTFRLYRLLDKGDRQLAREIRVQNWTGEGTRSPAGKVRDRDPSPYGITMETVLFLPLGRYLAAATEAPGSPITDSKEPFDTTQFLQVLVSRSKSPRQPATFLPNPRSMDDGNSGLAGEIAGTIYPSAVKVSAKPVLRWRYEPRAPAEAYVYVFDETGNVMWERRTKGTSIRYDGSTSRAKLPLYWIIGAGNGSQVFRFEKLPKFQPGR